MTVELRAVTRENVRNVLALHVDESQREFVATNADSLAQAYACHECIPLAIYADDSCVGFCMYALDEDDGEYWIYRLMIDRREQGRGYGKAAMEALIGRVRREAPEREVLYISFEPQNERARALYERLGFRPDGRVLGGEIVYRLALSAQGEAHDGSTVL